MRELRPFFSYFGGKWRAAINYPPPQHTALVEPFAGSAGYACRYPHLDVLLVDKDECIAGVWEYLIGSSPADIIRLPLVPAGSHVDDFAWPCPEARDFVGLNITRGADAPRRSATRWGDPNRWRLNGWTEYARERVASQVGAIKHWLVQCGDYSEAPDIEATWFVDSPYESLPDRYRCGGRHLDYHHLGEWCRSRRGQVIVCEAEGASWLPFVSFGRFKSNKNNSGRARSAEAIWVNAFPGHQLWVPAAAKIP